VNAIIVHEGPHSKLRAAIGRDVKGKISIVIYAVAVLLAYVNPLASYALYVAVALIWLVPDRRIEKRVQAEHSAR
jgi:uncharacterized membrane protein